MNPYISSTTKNNLNLFSRYSLSHLYSDTVNSIYSCHFWGGQGGCTLSDKGRPKVKSPPASLFSFDFISQNQLEEKWVKNRFHTLKKKKKRHKWPSPSPLSDTYIHRHTLTHTELQCIISRGARGRYSTRQEWGQAGSPMCVLFMLMSEKSACFNTHTHTPPTPTGHTSSLVSLAPPSVCLGERGTRQKAGRVFCETGRGFQCN